MLNLWDRAVESTRRASERGRLEPIATDREVVVQAGIPFVVHILARFDRKERETTEQRRSGANPFVPLDPELFVADVSDTHVAVLNRFNVLDHHLLIVTRSYVDQCELLDLADFEALGAAMAEVDGLGFYNAGTVAGASQPHKHIQLVPLPLGLGPRATPLDAALDAAQPAGIIHRASVYPFQHAIVRLVGTPLTLRRAPEMFDAYRKLLEAIDIRDTSKPYNLLVTRQWMLAVPRNTEFFEGISINALGFAGSLLVRDRGLLVTVRSRGPITVLRSVV